MNAALFMFVLLSHAFDVDLISRTAANGAASYRGDHQRGLFLRSRRHTLFRGPTAAGLCLRIIWGLQIPHWRGKKNILSGWLGEQFDLPYQMLPCVSLFQSVTKMRPQRQCLNAGGHVCVTEMFYLPPALMPFNVPAVGSVVFA